MGVGAYLLWGAFPLYFHALAPASAVEVLTHRIVWSSLTCLLIVAALRSWRQLGTALRDRRTMLLLSAAAVLVSSNWLIYTAAVLADHVVEAALGYYINPLLTVLLGVVLLRERLHPLQWTGIGLAATAVLVLTVGYGRPPWIALGLATTFALYGLTKNRLGRSVSAVTSLTLETTVLLPLALTGMVWLATTGRLTFLTAGGGHSMLLAVSGLVTSVPLLLFAAAAARIPLSLLGLLQYLTPTTQLLMGVLLFGEPMTPLRWAGFALVWLALVLFSSVTLATMRGTRAPRPAGPDPSRTD